MQVITEAGAEGDGGGGGELLSLVLTVPLHARYPHPRAASQQAGVDWLRAARSTLATVLLPPPAVLVRCGAGRGWQAATQEAAAAADEVQWDIAAGNLGHGWLVVAATVAAVGCSVVTTLAALCRPLGAAGGQRPGQRRRQRTN